MSDPEHDAELDQRVQGATWTVLGAALLVVLLLFSIQCPHGEDGSRADYPRRVLPPEPEPVLLPAAALSDDYFPCTDCHDQTMPPNPVRRALEEDHEDIATAHGDLWCLQCHSVGQRDSLQLSDGTPVGYEESWKLCTQCHGKKLADWRAGIHGKRTGHWWGPKEYRTCTTCHDPHAPRFKALEPLPPPREPTHIQSASVASEATPAQEAEQ